MTDSLTIVVFACNWDGLSCVEEAAHAHLSFPASVKVVRVSCLSRIHLGLILGAFQRGADGVMLLGCAPDDCHFDPGGSCVNREFTKARQTLDMLGLGSERVMLVNLVRGDGYGFVAKIQDFMTRFGTAPTLLVDAGTRARTPRVPSFWQLRTDG